MPRYLAAQETLGGVPSTRRGHVLAERLTGLRINTLSISLILSAHLVAGAFADDKAKPFVSPSYEIRRAGMPIQMDGKLDEPAWLAAPSLGEFVFPWSKEGKKEQSVAKVLWDDENLYIAHICEDAHITARHADHDGKIPEDDCFEIMFAPNAEKPEVYFNVEWNVIGGYVDNHRPNGPKQPRAPVWDAEGVRIAGRAYGTLNDDSDTDSHWICEVAIPFRNFEALTGRAAPRAGDVWYANFNRHGGQTNVQYGQWSPGDTLAPAFHTPHRFGKLTFSKKNSPFDVAE